jgi:D-serine deaminase-like pyridoxal phosphate-dependent protein
MTDKQDIVETAGIGAAALANLDDVVLSWRHKAMPPDVAGTTAGDLVRSGLGLADLQTPLLTLDRAAIEQNVARMADWCEQQGVLLAPHGKTTMAPQLWSKQLAHGAWGITVAGFAQLRVARDFGVQRLQLANSLTDPRGIEWVAGQVAEGAQICSWVDAVDTVRLQEQTLRALGSDAVLDVLVEVGRPGGRTGARGAAAALDVARAVSESDRLRLVGVSGYEGSLAHDASSLGLGRVRDFLADMRSVHEAISAEDLYEPGADIILTAGGSAYFDEVVSALRPCVAEPGSATNGRRVDVVLRAGAYVIHDDGFYGAISPFSRDGSEPFRVAMHGWARVVSRPEPGLAILDAGKRDMPADEGFPKPRAVCRSLGGNPIPLVGATVTAVNDQHCYMSLDPAVHDVRVGDVIQLGLSHPCTALDKWTVIPVLAETERDQRVVELVHTFF